MRRSRLARITSAAAHLQVFAIAGISAVLLIRTWLASTGYPKLGAGDLHIAHVLWGGLLMAVGLGLTLAFLGERARTWGALLGGAGFGTFLDEVGKFVTERNDYFYRPAAGIIYLVFAVLVVLAQWLKGRTGYTAAERTANALHAALVGVTSGLTVEQRRSAIRLVQDSGDPLDAATVRLLGMVPPSEPPRFPAVRAALAWLERLCRRPVVVVLAVVYLAVRAPLPLVGLALESSYDSLGQEREWGAVIGLAASAAVTVLLSLWGAARLRWNRPAAFQALYLALLVDILFGQVFAFIVNQFSAVPGLVADLLVLAVLGTTNRHLRRTAPARDPGDGPGARAGNEDRDG
ncbi:hypothetical protein ACFFV7_43715 [Nonomuraea spiralis]|uniref:Uncharacterized protein n=1 Tax=Nonomuraea spiralis TaxID=46182 RepID=A0ABV5IUE0_9ACTN|nr:hypothetical protein [Nonomuraea spiralis]